MKRYVLGFYLVPEGCVLIRKPRGWGGYQWNGTGGKIEPGETPLDAMVREFQEEAGVITSPINWRQLLVLNGDTYGDASKPWEMTVFTTASNNSALFAHLPRQIDEGLVSVESRAEWAMMDSTAAWLWLMCEDIRKHQLALSAPMTPNDIIEGFYRRVCERAEKNMAHTGTISGAHWNAMRQEMAAMGIAIEGQTP